MNSFATIKLADFIEYCMNDSTIFFDFKYDETNKNLDIRITNEIGACYPDQLIKYKEDIQRDRTFRLSGVEKFKIDKYSDLACDSILDGGYEKNQIWFLLGEGETLRIDIKEGFVISII